MSHHSLGRFSAADLILPMVVDPSLLDFTSSICMLVWEIFIGLFLYFGPFPFALDCSTRIGHRHSPPYGLILLFIFQFARSLF